MLLRLFEVPNEIQTGLSTTSIARILVLSNLCRCNRTDLSITTKFYSVPPKSMVMWILSDCLVMETCIKDTACGTGYTCRVPLAEASLMITKLIAT